MTNITILKEAEIWDKEIVQELQGASTFLAEMLNNTLDIAKLEEGKIEFNNKYDTIQNVIDVVLGITKANAQKKGITLESIASPGLPSLLEFDKSRLTQVVMNLTGNAIKFTPEKGKVTINTSWRLKCEFSEGDCSTCKYSLANNTKDERDSSVKVQNGIIYLVASPSHARVTRNRRS